jgi:maltose O-acetyltransferase
MDRVKYFVAEATLYICNHIVAHVPSRRIRSLFYQSVMKFVVGPRGSIHMGCDFTSRWGLVIGGGTVINRRCIIDTRGRVFIGQNVSISSDVKIFTTEHDIDDPFFSGTEAPVVIQDRAFVGTAAIILPGVTLGEGAVLCAGSIATKSIPPFEVWGGSPARYIRDRSKRLEYLINYSRFLH